MPFASASSAIGDRDTLRPRPATASGREITPTTSWSGDSRSRCSEGTATSGVPANTIRTSDSFGIVGRRHCAHPMVGGSTCTRIGPVS
ncbi:Uncharacterised protein [Mycobacteroides abscessus subsp. abscessus]|nr:Uncharacterised protein [Mycobacteroides abscessus subsp. abscessus]